MSLTVSLVLLTTLVVILVVISAKSYAPGHAKPDLSSKLRSHRKTSSNLHPLRSKLRQGLRTGRCKAGEICNIQRPKGMRSTKNKKRKSSSRRGKQTRARNVHAKARHQKIKSTHEKKLEQNPPKNIHNPRKQANKKSNRNKFAHKKSFSKKKGPNRRKNRFLKNKKGSPKSSISNPAILAKKTEDKVINNHKNEVPTTTTTTTTTTTATTTTVKIHKKENSKHGQRKLKNSHTIKKTENMDIMMNDAASPSRTSYIYDSEKKRCKKITENNDVDSYDSLQQCEKENEIVRKRKVVTPFVYYYMPEIDYCEMDLPNREDLRHDTLAECRKYQEWYKKTAEVIYKVDKSFTCPYGETPCTDRKRCVPNSQRCDLYADCEDYSDEWMCEKNKEYLNLSDEKKRIMVGAIDRNNRARKEYFKRIWPFWQPPI